MKRQTSRHYEKSVFILASPQDVFDYVDDQHHFSSHMTQPSWMLGGGYMNVEIDGGCGRVVNSHIRLNGKAFGINLFVDEVVIQHDSPYRKTWHTVGDLKLLVIGQYQMGFVIIKDHNGSKLKVFIDYEFPVFFAARLLGYMFGNIYARWCVDQIICTTAKYFIEDKSINNL
ncbi:MAG: hypothetical protein LiPW41_182 [Parcubacteria group bacterium LiPW_41]|nr:MAG: hypothetical protein LiPW41_182 [Parcubacteria group bacterium LiPW_41]